MVAHVLPPFSRIYWGFNPLAWAIRSLSINELTAPRWQNPKQAVNGVTVGDQVLLNFGFFSDKFWIWAGVGFLWGWILLYTGMGAIALTITNPGKPQPTGEAGKAGPPP